jgi:hypothetical protein
LITKAIACGKEYAHQIICEYGATDIPTLAERLKLKIDFKEVSMSGKRIVFASYTTPDKIEIMKEPVCRAVQLLSKEASVLVELFQQKSILNTILGHEIFHFIEEKFEGKIYTRTEKIRLWNFFGIKNDSTIRTLGEIGAMAFTKELNSLEYSPFILDILLYFSYDSSNAKKMYHDVLEMNRIPYST